MIPSVKISVIIPIYNMEKYLRFCLDSILAQTFKDIEILCINDCSTDTTGDIINEYYRKDSRIRHISLKENSGVSVARNRGLDEAKGEYVFFVDPDDGLPTKNALKVLYDCAVEDDVDEVSGQYVCYNEDTQEFPYWESNITYHKQDILAKNLTSEFNLLNNITVWNKLIKLSFLRKYRMSFDNDLKRGQDAFFTLQFYSYLGKASRLSTVTYCLRRNGKYSLSPTYQDDARTPYYLLLLMAKSLEFIYSNNIYKQNSRLFIIRIEFILDSIMYTALFESWFSFCDYVTYARKILILYPLRHEFSANMREISKLIMDGKYLQLWFRLLNRYHIWMLDFGLFFKIRHSTSTSHLARLLDDIIQSLCVTVTTSSNG